MTKAILIATLALMLSACSGGDVNTADGFWRDYGNGHGADANGGGGGK